jgi:hypothetical protein
MYNNPYVPNIYNSQPSVDRINSQIAELEKMKQQLQQPVAAPTSLTQNFQIAPTNREVIRYANSMEEVERDMVMGDTPYFSKDMSVVWIKNTKGDIKTYELNELIVKDDKDVKIELLMSEIEELKKGMKNSEYNANTNESVENEKPSDVSTISKSSKKSK